MLSSATPSSSLQRVRAGNEAGEGKARAMGVTGADAERVIEGVEGGFLLFLSCESMSSDEVSARRQSEREEAKNRFGLRAQGHRGRSAPFPCGGHRSCRWIVLELTAFWHHRRHIGSGTLEGSEGQPLASPSHFSPVHRSSFLTIIPRAISHSVNRLRISYHPFK